MTEAGEASLRAIVQAAEISKPKRLLPAARSQTLSVQQLASTLPLLLELEVSLKQEQRICQHL